MSQVDSKKRKPGSIEAKFDEDDGIIAKQDWPAMPMAAIDRGSLAIVRGAVDACSVSGKQPNTLRLITIGFSPYCEKVRWTLDLAGVPYTEDAHAPGFHAFATLPATKGRASATPVLVLRNGTATWDSTSIMKRLVAMYHNEVGFLYPLGMGAEVEALEEHLDENLGPHTRQWQYYYTLRDEALASSFFTKFNAVVERWLLPFVYPDLRKGLRRALKLDDDHRDASLAEVDKVFTDVATMLSDGRKYLLGDEMTAADITFASLAYPVLHPPQLQYLLPEFSELPGPMKQVISQHRDTVAGKFALKLYKTRRFRPRSNMSRVILRSGKRDQVPYLLLAVLATLVMLVIALLRWLMNTQP